MGRAIAKNTRFAVVPEVTENTTPATPAFQILRVTGESLEVERAFAFSSELDGKRGEKNYAISRAMGSGGFDFEFSDNTFEPLLESALRNTWATDALVDGTTPKPFTLEATFETGTTDIFKRLTGAHVNTFNLSGRAGEVWTGSMGLMARGSDYASAAIAGATYTAPGTEPILVGADFSSLTMTGLTIGCMASVNLNLNNNITPEMCLGSLSPTGLAPGKLEVTGSLSIYLADDEVEVLTAYKDGVSTSLQFTVGRSAGSRTRFNLPVIILEGMKTVAESSDGSVLIETNFRALQASSLSGSVIQITRNV